jgi:C1A family cysteine protease
MLRCQNPASAAIGGHAVVGVGYDDAKQWFVVRNSWGGDGA